MTKWEMGVFLFAISFSDFVSLYLGLSPSTYFNFLHFFSIFRGTNLGSDYCLDSSRITLLELLFHECFLGYVYYYRMFLLQKLYMLNYKTVLDNVDKLN